MWGNVTRATRSLTSAILTHCGDHPAHRDNAIRWTGAFCVATMHFIRREYHIPTAELAGFLKRQELDPLDNAEHQSLYVASQIRYYLRKALKVDAKTPVQIAHARTIHMQYMSGLIDVLIEQVSGMERIRSTPLPVVYTSHLRTFLFVYLLFLPYIWVKEWSWGTIFLVAFTAFALFGIEGASSEVEIPFNKHRPNHLALDAYCVTILDNIQSLVIHEANLDMQEQIDADDDDDENEAQQSTIVASQKHYTGAQQQPPQQPAKPSNHQMNSSGNHDPSEYSTGAIDDALAELGSLLHAADKEFASLATQQFPSNTNLADQDGNTSLRLDEIRRTYNV